MKPFASFVSAAHLNISPLHHNTTTVNLKKPLDPELSPKCQEFRVQIVRCAQQSRARALHWCSDESYPQWSGSQGGGCWSQAATARFDDHHDEALQVMIYTARRWHQVLLPSNCAA